MSYTLPRGLRLDRVRKSLAGPGQQTTPAWSLSDPPAGLTFRLDIVCMAGAANIGATQYSVAPGATTNFELFDAPTLVAPAADAQVAWPPTFSLAGAPGSSGTFFLQLFAADTGDPEIILYTNGPAVTVPALDVILDVPLPISGRPWGRSVEQHTR